MARANVTHSQDGVQVTFLGDRRNPEPSMAVIQFPGGHVEVSRCSDGSYWAHIGLRGIGLPKPDHIKHIAVRITSAVTRPAHE